MYLVDIYISDNITAKRNHVMNDYFALNLSIKNCIDNIKKHNNVHLLLSTWVT